MRFSAFVRTGILHCTAAGGLLAQDPAPRDSATPVEPIVVTVARAPSLVTTVPFAVTMLDGDRLVAADPGLSLGGVLARVPGVTAWNRHNPAQDERLAIRGFGARAAFGIRGLRILLDGIPQTLPDGQGQLTNIDLRHVDRIEVLRGASSALYGNAAGGVVSIRTAADPLNRVTAEARAFGSGDGLRAADAGVTAPLGGGQVTVRGAHTRQDGFRDQSRLERWRASVRGMAPLGRATRLNAVVHVADLPVAQDPGALTSTELAADPTQANPAHVGVGAGKDVFQGQAGVSVEHRAGGASIQAAGFVVWRDLLNTLPFATIDLERWAYGARTLATLPVAPFRGEVTIGVDLQWQRDDRTNTSPDGSTTTRDQFERVREIGPFLQVRTAPIPKLTLTAGARLDAVRFQVSDRLPAGGDESGDRTMSALSGTVGMVVSAAEWLAPFASVGTAFEAPTTTELANQPDGSDGFNPDLDPQRALQFEVGARGQWARLTYSIAAYWTEVRDALVPFEVPDVPGRRFFRNAGRTRHRGLEVSLTASPVPALRLTGAYTQADLRFREFATPQAVLDGNHLPGVPTRFFSGALALHRGAVTADLEVRTASSFFVDDANSLGNEGWWVADLRLAAVLGGGAVRATPFVGVENVFDRRYVEAVVVNAGFGRYFEPAPGRRVYVGAGVGY